MNASLRATPNAGEQCQVDVRDRSGSLQIITSLPHLTSVCYLLRGAHLRGCWQKQGTAWTWRRTYANCLVIEAWIQVLITTTPSDRQHSAAMWMWCGTYVSCLLIEV